MIGVQFAVWQAIDLPRQRDGSDAELDEGPEEHLGALAESVGHALAAWNKSLKLLLPTVTRLH